MKEINIEKCKERARKLTVDAIKLRKVGKFQEAILTLKKSKKNYELIHNYKEIITCNNRLGQLYALIGEDDNAIQYFNESLKISESKDGLEKENTITLNVIAHHYMAKKEWENAREYYEKSLEKAQKIGDKERVAISLNSIADFYKTRGYFKEAIHYYEMAIQTTKELLKKEGILISLNKLGSLYQRTKDWDKAIKCYEDILEILDEKNNLFETLISHVVLWDIYKKNDNEGLASKHYKKYVEIIQRLEINEDEFVKMALDCNFKRNEGEWKKITEECRRKFRIILNSKIVENSLFLNNEIKQNENIMEMSLETSVKSINAEVLKREKIIQYHITNFESAKKINYMRGMLNSLKALGNISKDYEKSLNYYQQSLEIAKKVDDKNEILNILQKIGSLYVVINKLNEAEIYYQQAIDFSYEVGDKKDIYMSLKLLGDTYRKGKKYNEAIKTYKDAVKEIQHDSTKELMYIYDIICTMYRNLKDKENERYYLGMCIKIAKDSNLNDNVCSYSHRIGSLYKAEGNYNKALEFYSECLLIYQTQDNKKKMLYYLNILGALYKIKEDHKTALDIFTFYIKLARELGDKQKEARGLKQIGDLCKPSSEEAVKYYEQSLHLAKEINSKEETVDALKSLGDVYFKEDWQKALLYYKEGMKISDEMGLQKKTSNLLIDMGNLYKYQEINDKALECYKLSLKVFDGFFKNKGICADNFDFYETHEAKYNFQTHLSFIGDLCRKEKLWEDAEKYYGIGMEIANLLESQEEIYNLNIKYVELYQSLEKWSEALSHSLKANKIGKDIYLKANEAAQSTNSKEIIYQALSNLMDSYRYSGILYDKCGDQKKSLESYELALEISRNLKCSDEIKCEDLQEGRTNYSEMELNRLLSSIDQVDSLYPKNKAWEKIREHCEECKDKYLENKSKRELLEPLLIIGDIYNRKNIFEKAFQYYSKCLEISRELNDEKYVSICLRSEGDLYNKKGNFDLANDRYKKSLEVCENIGNRREKLIEQLLCLSNLAYLNKDLDKYNNCLYISELLGDVRKTFNIRKNMGNIFKNMGNFELALNNYKICREIAREKIKDKKEIANILISIGSVYKDQGKWKESEKVLKAGIRFAKKNKFDKVMANACNELGYLYQDTGEWDKARKCYLNSLRKSKKYNQEKEISISLNFLGNLSQNIGEWERAKAYLEESMKISKELNYEKGISITSKNLGNLHRNQGEWENALNYYKEGIRFAQKIGDKRLIASSLNNLGNLLQNQGNRELSLKCYDLGLKFAENINHKKTIFEILNSKGDLFRDRGLWKEAKEIYKESQSICFHLGYKKGRAISYNNFGHLYQNKGEWNKALRFYEKSLNLSEELHYAEWISIVNNSLGYLYKQKGDWRKAIEYYKESITISKQLDFKKELLKSYNQVGDIYSRFEGNKKKAKNCLNESLSLSRKMDNKKGIACSYHFMGLYCRRIGNWDEALTYYRESFKLFETIDYKKGMSESLRKTGNLYRDRGFWENALNNYLRSKEISQEIGYKLGTSRCLRNLGNLYRNKGEWSISLGYYEDSLNLIDRYDLKGKSRCLRDIANLYKEECEWEKALIYYTQSLAISEEIGDSEGTFATSNGIIEVYLETGRWKEAERQIKLKLNELDKRSSLLQSTFLKNYAELLCFKDDYNSAIEKLKEANFILKNSKAKPQKIDILIRLGEVYLEQYKLNKKNTDLKKSEIFFKYALKISSNLKMPLKIGAIKRSLGIQMAESKELDTMKESEVRNLFLESIGLFRENKTYYELYKSLFEYSKFLHKIRSYAESEAILKSIIIDTAKFRNHELIVDSYLLLGDIEIILDKGYSNYLKALEITDSNTESYVRTCYQLIFRIQRLFKNRTIEISQLKEFIYSLKKQNTDYYFDLFLKSLIYRIDGSEINEIKLPKSLELELDKFRVSDCVT